MGTSKEVLIKLESRQDGTDHIHSFRGELFRKERSLFVRYSELVGQGDSKTEEIRTIIRYRPDELSLVRRGAVESEQLFSPGRRRSGSYQSAMTAFRLETETSLLQLYPRSDNTEQCVDGSGGIAFEEELPAVLPFTIEWKYELLVDDQLSGRFHIRLHIQEETES